MSLPKKFKSEEDLVKAYENLEKEFTKRCEKVSQLQKQVQDLTESLSQKGQEQVLESSREISDQEREQIIQEFLKEVVNSKSQAKLSGGGQAVLSPPRKPKNLKEANLMAKFLLKGE